jgi:hypothetical protein
MMSRSLKFCLLLFIAIYFFPWNALGQETLPKKSFKDFVQFKGYLKDLQVSNFANLDSMTTYGYLHNRLNFKFYPSKNLTGAVEIRNRIYYGDMVQKTPHFGEFIDQSSGFYKLSSLVINQPSLVMHSMIDRMWLNYTYNKWELRVGRQRINWGKTLVWNPNDLFNTFNYANFDYEEQPGSDAVKLTYYPSGMSALEFGIKPGKNKDETVAAGIWKFNKHNYDFQVLSGLYYTDIALGLGWSGNIKNAGFNGEATWFQPKNNLSSSNGVLSATLMMDYSFKKPISVQGGFLFNNHPNSNNSGNLIFQQSLTNNLSAKNLMPSNWSLFNSISGNITPLFRTDLAIITGIDKKFIFTMPSISYSLSDNWDITVLEQGVFFLGSNSTKPFNSFYIRVKWSF